MPIALRWRHNEHDGIWNHQRHGCLLNRLFRRKSKKTSKLRVTSLCEGNSLGTGEFPAQMAKCFHLMTSSWAHRVSSVTSKAFWNVSTENPKGLVPSNRPVAQNPQWNSPISHNSPFSNWNMHISVVKWCSVGYVSNASDGSTFRFKLALLWRIYMTTTISL